MWAIFFILILMNIVSFVLGYFTRYGYSEWKLRLIERNLIEYHEYQRWLTQNKAGLKTADGKLPEYF